MAATLVLCYSMHGFPRTLGVEGGTSVIRKDNKIQHHSEPNLLTRPRAEQGFSQTCTSTFFILSHPHGHCATSCCSRLSSWSLFLLVARVVGLSPSRRQSTTILWASSVPLCNVLVAGLWLLGVRVGLLSLLCPRWGQSTSLPSSQTWY